MRSYVIQLVRLDDEAFGYLKRVIVPLYQPQESGHTAFALVEMAHCNSTAHMTYMCVCVCAALCGKGQNP